MASISSCTKHHGVSSSDYHRMHRCLGIGSSGAPSGSPSGLATPIFSFSLSSLEPKSLRMAILTIILVKVLCCHSITKITRNGINGAMFVTYIHTHKEWHHVGHTEKVHRSYCWYIYTTYTAYINKRKTRVEYFTRMIVAEVVPSAWPLAMLIPSTFNLHRWNIKNNFLCI